MGLADDFERRLEQVVEGFFSRAFRSNIQPAEIGRRLLREMEGGKSVSVGAVYVPNHYTVLLAPGDYDRFEGLIPTLKKDFAQLLKEAAQDRRWRPAGPLVLAFQADQGVRPGKFQVDTRHDAEISPPEPEIGTATLRRLGDEEHEWPLDSDELVVGRQETCDIVVPDPNTSRRHARLARREDGWWIIDLGATNGTLVNGSLVKERRLHTGDRIQIGTTELEYQDASGEAGG